MYIFYYYVLVHTLILSGPNVDSPSFIPGSMSFEVGGWSVMSISQLINNL